MMSRRTYDGHGAGHCRECNNALTQNDCVLAAWAATTS